MSFAVLPVVIYLSVLMIAPQLWVQPFLGMRVDLYIYPFWFLVLVLRGRLGELLRFRTQDWFFVAMLFWIVLSMLTNGLRDYSGTLLFDYIKYFVLYRMTVASIDSADNLRRTGWILLILGLILSVEGVQHMNSEDGLGWAGQSFAWTDPGAATIGIENRTRWINIFDGPGVFCVVFTIALPFAMQYLASPYSVPARFVALVVMVPVLLLAIYYTGSRGGILTTLAIFGLYFLAKSGLSTRKLIVILALAGPLGMVGPSYLTSTKDSSGSAQHRVEMWIEGIEMVQYNPVFGIGKGNFLSYTNRLIAHNSAIENMGETGIVGLFFWLGISYTGLRTIVHRFRQTVDPRERELLLALGLSISGYIVSSMFVTLEYETYYFLLALSAAVGNWTEEQEPYSLRDFWIMAAIVAGFVVTLKVFVMGYF